MNQLRNSVTLIGHLGRDPEYWKLSNGKTLAKISLATNEYYRDQHGELVKNTQWHNCVAWGRLADNMNELLRKGREVMVRGRLTYRNYEDRNGERRYYSEIVVQEFLLLGKKEEVGERR